MEILSYENIIITKTMNYDLEYKFCDFANYDVLSDEATSFPGMALST